LGNSRKLALLLALALAGCAATPPADVAYSFALLGDTPYSQAQANLLDGMIERINAEPLAFAVHIGDITSGVGPCDDGWLEARARQFAAIRHPFVLLPGDNEWTDCHRGGFEPLERLEKWRRLFCAPIPALGLERQKGRCEHVRWRKGDALYVGLNVPGSNNNLGRTPEMDAEHAARMREVFEWLDESVELARSRRLARVMILFQANPFVSPRVGMADGYASFRDRLRALASEGAHQLILVHGDTHHYRDDRPLTGVRRVEVFGAPHVRWLRASAVRGEFFVEPAD